MRRPRTDGLEPLLSVARTAEILGVSKATLYRGIDGLAQVRVGRSIRFRRSDVVALMSGRRPAPAADTADGSGINGSTLDDAEAREVLLQKAGEAVVAILQAERVGPTRRIVERIEQALQRLVDEGA